MQLLRHLCKKNQSSRAACQLWQRVISGVNTFFGQLIETPKAIFGSRCSRHSSLSLDFLCQSYMLLRMMCVLACLGNYILLRLLEIHRGKCVS